MGKFDGITLGQNDFVDEVSKHTVLTKPELKKMFATPEEEAAFLDLLKVIDASTSENEQKAELIGNIGKYAGVVIKLARKAALGV